MIRSFANRDTERVWNRRYVRSMHPELQRRALAKLATLDVAGRLDDLRTPPGNELEHLSGDRFDQHSIRINRQWRICFHWTDDGPENVEITDDH